MSAENGVFSATLGLRGIFVAAGFVPVALGRIDVQIGLVIAGQHRNLLMGSRRTEMRSAGLEVALGGSTMRRPRALQCVVRALLCAADRIRCGRLPLGQLEATLSQFIGALAGKLSAFGG